MTTLFDPSKTSTPAQIEDQAIQLHREFADIVKEQIGMNDQFANAVAAAIVRGMRERYSGQTFGRKGSIYIPAPNKTQRNDAIRTEFCGNNVKEICKKYGIGRSRLYQIVNERA